MSDLKNVFDIAGRSMAAQMVRLNTVASNIANAGARAGSAEEAFRPLRPVFQVAYDCLLYNLTLPTNREV